MNINEYYHHVYGRMKNNFQFNHYFIATGNELVQEGYDPAFPAAALPVSYLEHATVERALQVHLPVIGQDSWTVLMPLDFEIYLAGDNHLLYQDRGMHRHIFSQIVPVARFLEELLRSRGIPYLLDYTPSGGHVLWHNIMGHRATEALKHMGFLEFDLINACNYRDPHDIRRWNGVSLDAARVFSALGKIAEYIALLVMEAFRDNESKGLLPVTISDSIEHCINMDNSWSEGSPFMRSIRSPMSLHKKNREKYGKTHQPSLVDVIGTYFDGSHITEERDMNAIMDCMWDVGRAAEHSQWFSGYIPHSNDSLVDFIREYQSSDLYEYHRIFENSEEIPRGQALEYARREQNIPDWTRDILYHPNPSALQPQKIMGLVYDFLYHAHWHPRHIANILRDCYINPGFNWTQNFVLYPAEEKANFWARTSGAVALWRNGHLRL